jgi:hypothetical protein
MIKVAELIVVVLVFVNIARAELPAEPYAKAFTAPNGRFVFILVPNGTKENANSAIGTMFELVRGGMLREQWRTDGWFDFDVFPSDDGHMLIRITSPVFGRTPSKSDIVLRFYNEGNIVKSYSVMDLMRPPFVVRRTMSFYEWISRAPSKTAHIAGARFYLTTIDSVSHSFDISSGLETTDASR